MTEPIKSISLFNDLRQAVVFGVQVGRADELLTPILKKGEYDGEPLTDDEVMILGLAINLTAETRIVHAREAELRRMYVKLLAARKALVRPEFPFVPLRCPVCDTQPEDANEDGIAGYWCECGFTAVEDHDND